jgi:flavin reductase (DIM6/NTAB) family NADH-FMN oxidoreductase RutF/DNA-binding GntR family transcriptional regulator
MSDPSALPALDQAVFRDVIGRFASGVTVISTRVGDRDLGTTASAVSSLSMDPPMLLICMNRTSETGQAIAESGRFVVNILGEAQVDIATHFAKKAPDKFSGVEMDRGLADMPRIANALGHLECRVGETATGGTHWVFLSHVESASASEGSPLTYYRGKFGRFDDAAQEAAYRQVRRFVMDRGISAGGDLTIEGLADGLDLERPLVEYALMKLTADGLVERDPEHGYRVRGLDARTAIEAISTRCLIEVAVAERVVGKVAEERIAELKAHADGAVQAVAADPPDYERLRRCGRSFHETFIGLADNDTLLDTYLRLRIDAIWGRLLKGRHLDPTYLVAIADACAAGDAAAARRALEEHAEHAARVVEDLIEDAGGIV